MKTKHLLTLLRKTFGRETYGFGKKQKLRVLFAEVENIYLSLKMPRGVKQDPSAVIFVVSFVFYHINAPNCLTFSRLPYARLT